MRCKKAKKPISLYLAPDDSWLSPNDRQALEAHMAVCEPCREDCRESREVVSVLQKCRQVSEDTAALLEKGCQVSPHRISARIIKLHGASRRVAVWAAAACLVIAVLSGLVPSNREAVLTGPNHSVALTGKDLPLVIKLADGGHITPGAVIQTSAREIGNLVINGRHRVVMNAGTRLSIEPFVKAGRIECLVSLALGEINVHVEHDGHPFIVQTAHGRAVITGTTSDVKATDASTTLVVAEGSVRFESEKGLVEVASGQISKIIAHSAPTSPVSCNAAELTAWAVAYELKPASAKIQSISDDYDLTDLRLSAISGLIELERINYEDWIEEKRAWFEREFPWTAQLQSALIAEGIEADYPELLMSSADIWQFVYPQNSHQRFPFVYFDPLRRAASKYGFDELWLMTNVSAAKSAIDKHVSEDLYTGQEAFEHWIGCFERLRKSQEPPDSDTLLSSFHDAVYLSFCVRRAATWDLSLLERLTGGQQSG
jgi:ferric-dicitrate binding protein FerR (iron transport regulator)